MKLTKVRCWKILVAGAGHGDELLITYPEGHYGHALWSCLECGQIYAACIADEMYSGISIQEKLNSLNCVKCGSCLGDSAAPYPEKYRNHVGDICTHERSLIIPDDDKSIVVKLPDIYT